jgi:hypothetical protein
MTLLAPWAIWFAALGAAVVALYLLKIKRQRQEVPALEFWRNLLGPAPVRSLFQRLKRWLSLALWLLILATLILALGNPIVSFGRMAPRAIAVVLDNSASMQATEPSANGRTRLQLAQEALAEIAARRPVHDEWLLIESARRPRVLQSWTRNRQELTKAGENVAPHLGSSDLASATDLAGQLLEGKTEPMIILLTDGAGGESERLAAKDARVLVWPVGTTDDNLGITELSVRIDPQQTQYHVYVAVENAAQKEVDTQLVFAVDGSTVDVQPVHVASGGTWTRTITLPTSQSGILRVALDGADALAVDQEAFGVLEPVRPARVLLVSDPANAFFFEQALLAMEPLIDVEASRTVDLDEFEKIGADAPASDLVVFNNVAPRALPVSGAFVCVNAWPSDLPLRTIGELEQLRLVVSPHEHPLTRYLTVSGASLTRGKEVDIGQPATVLAASPTGAPLIFLCRQPDRQILCLAFDVLDTDLPFRNAFPILLWNAVTYMVAERHAWFPAQIHVGDSLTTLRPLPPGVSEVAVASLNPGSSSEIKLPVRNGAFTFEKAERVGAFRLTIGSETAHAAVNLTDALETRLAPARTRTETNNRLPLTGRLLGTMPWIALAVAGLLLVVAEWLTYHMRWTE